MEANFPRAHEIMEKLKQFPIKTVEEYGQCIVIPGQEWEPDWEGEIPNDCIESTVDNKPVILVQIRLPVILEQTVKGEENLKVNRWTEEDSEKLFKMAAELGETMLLKEVAHAIFVKGEFPGRTEAALKLKYAKMRGKKKNKPLKGHAIRSVSKAVDAPKETLEKSKGEDETKILEFLARIRGLETKLEKVMGFIDLFSAQCPCELTPKQWHNYWNSLEHDYSRDIRPALER